MSFIRFDEMEIIRDRVALPGEVNRDGTPVTVMEYQDPASGRAYQVDYRNHRFRFAPKGSPDYSEWEKFASIRKS